MQATRRGFSRFASRRNLVEQSVRTLSWVGSSKDDITKLITVPLVDTSLRRVVSIPSPLFLLPRSQRYVSTETQPMSSNGDRKADSPSQNQPASSENEDSKKPMPEEHEETKYEIDEEALLERQIKKQIQETEEKQKEQNTKQLFKSKRMMALFAAGAVSISVLMKILFDYKSVCTLNFPLLSRINDFNSLIHHPLDHLSHLLFCIVFLFLWILYTYLLNSPLGSRTFISLMSFLRLSFEGMVLSAFSV